MTASSPDPDAGSTGPPADPPEQRSEPAGPVDPRYLLANERTLLAWLRTGLALQAAGLAVAEFVTGPPRWVRGAMSGVLIAIGVLVAALGYRHARDVRRAMYDGKAIPDANLLTGVCLAVVVIGVLLGVAVLIAM